MTGATIPGQKVPESNGNDRWLSHRYKTENHWQIFINRTKVELWPKSKEKKWKLGITSIVNHDSIILYNLKNQQIHENKKQI